MNISVTSTTTSEYNVSGNQMQFVSDIDHYSNISSREFDTAWWTFDQDTAPSYNLTFLPVLALIVFVILVLHRVYKWFRDEDRIKTRGDVEFEDDEVNYGIITAGDRHFCQVDIRSDTTSVYDTVNSFRFMTNGYGPQHEAGTGGAHPYQDTVTSYKSLLMQKADGCQYDSVKSYKAFLQKVTQNTDLAVEVKLLENYPIRSKSAEHCVVVEEESSEKSEEISSKLLNSLPLKKQLHITEASSRLEKKKPRACRVSGDFPIAMRKRSASNPTYRKLTTGAASLPSIRDPTSSDSEEENWQSHRSDQRRLWAEKRRLYCSISGGKITKGFDGENHEKLDAVADHKRRRHFSDDSMRRPRTSLYLQEKGRRINRSAELKEKKGCDSKGKERGRKKSGSISHESSSENPDSSHSSCDVDVASDAVVSDSDDETNQNTMLSIASDRTAENDVFFSLDSGAELGSSAEILQNSPLRYPKGLSSTQASSDTDVKFLPYSGIAESHPSPLPNIDSYPQPCHSVQELDNSSRTSHSQDTRIGHAKLLSHNHSSETERVDVLKAQHGKDIAETLSSSALPLRTNSDSGLDPSNITDMDSVCESGSVPSSNSLSPRKVQRFHVTFVNADTSSVNSE